MSLAFRHLGIKGEHWKYLILKAKNPKDGKTYFFVDKCLPFGAAISCSHFQRFSNAVAHIVTFKTGKPLVNYLNDYLFVALLAYLCNHQIKTFLQICEAIQFPVSLKKTFWATTRLVFLDLLLDTELQLVLIPKEKILKGRQIVKDILEKKSGKVTVHKLQQLTGFLNFLGKAIIPGRAFTQRLYCYARSNLKPHHHVRLTGEMKKDLQMWEKFLAHPTVFSRPFMDFSSNIVASKIDMYSDAMTNSLLGFGATCQNSWMYKQWDQQFIIDNGPSIEYLELFALVAGVITWAKRFRNKRVTLFCDNSSVVDMVNNTSSSCKNLHGLD